MRSILVLLFHETNDIIVDGNRYKAHSFSLPFAAARTENGTVMGAMLTKYIVEFVTPLVKIMKRFTKIQTGGEMSCC